MKRFITNIIQSRALVMVILRYIFMLMIVIMGLIRLRLIIILLHSPELIMQKDVLQEYLLAKAILAGINPYLPLDELGRLFIGNQPFFTHPSPYPPFIAILFIPLTFLSVNNAFVVWFIIELICLIAIAIMLTVLGKDRINWVLVIFLIFLLLSWYPIMVDLLYGQLTILITTLLLAALIALQLNKNILSGILIGLTFAIKLFTWPIILYFILKKKWRIVIYSILTALVMNLGSLFIINIDNLVDFYLRVLNQVSTIYQAFFRNYSLWSIGYWLFEGTRPSGNGYIYSPPLINLPRFAPIMAVGLVIAFAVVCLILAIRTKDIDNAFSIMVCLSVAISPIAWDHYYVLLIIGMFIALKKITKYSLPNSLGSAFLILTFCLFFVNEHISTIILTINGGYNFLLEHGNRITFVSNLLSYLPILEIITLIMLLHKSGSSEQQKVSIDNIKIAHNMP